MILSTLCGGFFIQYEESEIAAKIHFSFQAEAEILKC